jgi:hypothetical protein
MGAVRPAEWRIVTSTGRFSEPGCIGDLRPIAPMSVCPPEDFGAAPNRPFSFQLYIMKDRGCVRSLATRA